MVYHELRLVYGMTKVGGAALRVDEIVKTWDKYLLGKTLVR